MQWPAFIEARVASSHQFQLLWAGLLEWNQVRHEQELERLFLWRVKDATSTKRDSVLSNTAGRTVLDKTGLAEDYAFTFEWSPADSAPDADSNAPSIFTAVQ